MIDVLCVCVNRKDTKCMYRFNLRRCQHIHMNIQNDGIEREKRAENRKQS